MVVNDALEATELRGGRYAVRPKGALGTCGFYPCSWSVHYVKARCASEAIRRSVAAGMWTKLEEG
jgi:hypothetical protein